MATANRKKEGGLDSVKGYFENIRLAATTIFEGMTITLSHLLRKPITVEYPDVDVESTLPDCYRGFLQVNLDSCISCRQCEKICPVDCIHIEDVPGEKIKVMADSGKEITKLKYPVVFKIDMAKCMFCGLCVESCAPEGLHFTKRFEGATRNINDLVLSFVDEEEAEILREKGREVEARKAAEKAEKAKAKARKEAEEREKERKGGRES